MTTMMMMMTSSSSTSGGSAPSPPQPSPTDIASEGGGALLGAAGVGSDDAAGSLSIASGRLLQSLVRLVLEGLLSVQPVGGWGAAAERSSPTATSPPLAPLSASCAACGLFQATVIVFGLATFSLLCFRLLILALRLLKGILFTRTRRLAELGEWAVVTGATDGIGRAMAAELLKTDRMSVVLISRSAERLQETKKQLAEDCRVSGEKIRTIAADFTSTRPELYEEIAAQLKGLDIGVLINNVGISYPHAMFFDEVDASLIDNLVRVNVAATFRMTRLVYPGMCARRRGAVVCVGSGASETPSDPLYCGYAGTKGAIEAFCRSLQAESASRNVLVQCHVPLLIASKLSKIRRTSLTVPSPKTYASAAVQSVRRGECSTSATTTVCPYGIHRWMLCLANAVPTALWVRVRLPQCLSIRARAMKIHADVSKRQ